MSKQKNRSSIGRLSAGSETLRVIRVLMLYYGDTTPLQLVTRLVARDMQELSERREGSEITHISKN